MHAPKKSVGQGLSRKPTYRAICFKFNLLCHRSSILDHINVFKLFQYFIHIRHHPTVCSCGLAARLFGILVFVANANSVFFFHKEEAKLKTFKHSFSRTGVKVWNLIPDHFMFLGKKLFKIYVTSSKKVPFLSE